jgi:hypothetical protein
MFGFWASHCSAECLKALVEAGAACENVMCGITEAGKFWWELLLLYTVVRSGDNDRLLGFCDVSCPVCISANRRLLAIHWSNKSSICGGVRDDSQIASGTLSSDRSTNPSFGVQRQQSFWSSGNEKQGASGIDMCF